MYIDFGLLRKCLKHTHDYVFICNHLLAKMCDTLQIVHFLIVVPHDCDHH